MNSNNNSTTCAYSLDNLRFRPYDRSSKIFGEKPGTNHFDDRHDHVLLRNQLGIGVLMDVTNLKTSSGGHPLGQRISMRAYLIDEDADSAVWSGSITHRFPALRKPGQGRQNCQAEIRFDIPLSYLQTIPTHRYIIQIDDEPTGQTLRKKLLRFYDLPQLKVLPTKWFDCRSGYIDPIGNDGTLEAGFLLSVTSAPIGLRLPEVEIRLHLPDKETLTRLVIPDNSGSDLLEAAASFVVPDLIHDGIGFAELCCMGYPFSGFLFDCGNIGQRVTFGVNHLHTFPDYTPWRARWKYDSLHELHAETTADAKCEYDETDENFDRELDKFIKSQLGKEASDQSSREDELTAQSSVTHLDAAADDVSTGIDGKHPDNVPSDPLMSLNRLTGLREVKRKVKEYADLACFTRLREKAGLPALPVPLHCLFLGSPGTGKTTVGKILGEILNHTGILSSGHVVVRERASLLGQNYHSESEKTLQALEEAQGGILFIDEAYQLYQPNDPRDPGKFVLETLMTALADESRRDWMLILGGYPEPMMRMLDMNPGLASRIPLSNHYRFDDFSPEELISIATDYLTNARFTLTPEADAALRRVITTDYENRPENFGNGRYVMNLIQTRVLPAAASRIVKIESPSTEALSQIEVTDIPTPEFVSSPRRAPLGFRA